MEAVAKRIAAWLPVMSLPDSPDEMAREQGEASEQMASREAAKPGRTVAT